MDGWRFFQHKRKSQVRNSAILAPSSIVTFLCWPPIRTRIRGEEYSVRKQSSPGLTIALGREDRHNATLEYRLKKRELTVDRVTNMSQGKGLTIKHSSKRMQNLVTEVKTRRFPDYRYFPSKCKEDLEANGLPTLVRVWGRHVTNGVVIRSTEG